MVRRMGTLFQRQIKSRPVYCNYNVGKTVMSDLQKKIPDRAAGQPGPGWTHGARGSWYAYQGYMVLYG